jgi:hypothetical protein
VSEATATLDPTLSPPPPQVSGAARRLSGVEKAVVLLMSLGPEKAAGVFRHLHDQEIEQLSSAWPRHARSPRGPGTASSASSPRRRWPRTS